MSEMPLRCELDFLFYPHVPSISLECTNLCNLKCPYCANQALTRRRGTIRWELLEKLVEECCREGYRLDTLHGTGEPLLYNRLEDAVRLIRSRNAGNGMFTTNATLLTPGRAKKLMDAGLQHISISLDTLEPGLYAKTRGADLKAVVKNIQDLIALAPADFYIHIYLMEHKDQHLTEATWKEFRETFGDRPNVRANTQFNGKFPSAPEDYRKNKYQSESCFQPGKFLFITHEGRVAICCADQDALGELGDVSRQTIKEVWYGAATQRTLRNVGVGVYDCPSVCTKSCILKAPRQDFTTVPAAVGLPWEKAFALATQLQAKGQDEVAREMCRLLKLRAPWHNQEVFKLCGEPWCLFY